MTARTVRLGVALALAGLLGQPVGALAFPPPPPTAPAVVKYSSGALPAGGQKTALGVDGTWTTRTGYSTPGRVAGPAGGFVQYPAPPIGQDCGTTLKSGVNLDVVAGPSRRATWVTPAVKFGVFHADQPAPSFYPLDPNLTTNDVSPLDTSVVNLNNNTTVLPGFSDLGDAIQNAPQAGTIITYVLRGKIADAAGTHVCQVTSVVELGHTPSQAWCTASEAFNGLNNHCSVPSVTLVAPTSPLCAPPRDCIPAVNSEISLDYLSNQARSIFTDGGTITASPIPGMELVQLPATFTLTGGPVDRPAQYMQIEVPIPNGGTSVGVVSYQIRISYKDTTWSFDDHSSIGPYPAEHPTDQSFSTFGSPAIVTNQLWIGHWMVRAVDNFAVEFRSVYYYNYPAPPVETTWAPFPGGVSTFQLCAQPATEPPPHCGPGTKAIWGQIEAIPVNPSHYP